MGLPDYSYEGGPWISYDGGALFVRVCGEHLDGTPGCFRYVKADDFITTSEYSLKDQANATCSRCGRVKMLFTGFYDPKELGVNP